VNGISITMPRHGTSGSKPWASSSPLRWDKYHIDILTANFCCHPDGFTSWSDRTLFGDILSDLGPAHRNHRHPPSRQHQSDASFRRCSSPCRFAPDIARTGIANPIGQSGPAAMMLEHLGEA